MLLYNSLKINIYNINDINNLSFKFSLLIKNSIYLYFQGCIGVGKSYFCNNLIYNLLKSKNILINSPSFNIINEYKYKNIFIYHIDLYNIKNEYDFYNIEIYNYLNNKNICLIEWSDKYINLLPICDLCFYFYFINYKKRFIYIKSFTNLGNKILNLI